MIKIEEILNKYNIFLTSNSFIVDDLKEKCDYTINITTYRKEIELFKEDYSNFWTLFFFIFFDNKKIFNFDRFEDKEITQILDNKNLSLYDKLSALKYTRRIYLKIHSLFWKNKDKMNRYKILLYDGKTEYFKSFMSLYQEFMGRYDITSIFLLMDGQQWNELQFENKSHMFGKIYKGEY